MRKNIVAKPYSNPRKSHYDGRCRGRSHLHSCLKTHYITVWKLAIECAMLYCEIIQFFCPVEYRACIDCSLESNYSVIARSVQLYVPAELFPTKHLPSSYWKPQPRFNSRLSPENRTRCCAVLLDFNCGPVRTQWLTLCQKWIYQTSWGLASVFGPFVLFPVLMREACHQSGNSIELSSARSPEKKRNGLRWKQNAVFVEIVSFSSKTDAWGDLNRKFVQNQFEIQC